MKTKAKSPLEVMTREAIDLIREKERELTTHAMSGTKAAEHHMKIINARIDELTDALVGVVTEHERPMRKRKKRRKA